MTPYYEEPGITIYHDDCRDVLPHLEPVDLVLTDPPYNVGKNYGEHNDRMTELQYLLWMKTWIKACENLTGNLVYFPGTSNLLNVKEVLSSLMFQHRHTLGWHKKEFAGDKWTSGPAMCWEPIIWSCRDGMAFFNKIFGTNGRDFLVINSTHGHGIDHPCPKPLRVMAWLISIFTPPLGMIIDPFMGSGTTLRAAKNLGRKAIGIEIEQKYCDIAIERLRQGVLI